MTIDYHRLMLLLLCVDVESLVMRYEKVENEIQTHSHREIEREKEGGQQPHACIAREETVILCIDH